MPKSNSLSRSLVRSRHGEHHEKRLRSKLRENLVHEEFVVDVRHVYEFRKGKKETKVGGFGVVQVVEHKVTGAKFAMKTVPLSGVKSQEAFDFVLREVDVLKGLDHPNIVRLQEVYVTPSHLYITMDLLTGGNLAEVYQFRGEEEAARIVRQLVNALRYCHERNVAHRDLKLENILLEHPGKNASVKLVDFGLSAMFEEGRMENDVLGSWYYVAPEVLKGKYLPAKADMWALGVVSYILLCGTPPFYAPSTTDIKELILQGRFSMQGGCWRGVGEGAKHFVRALLQRNPRLRMDARKAQSHRWLRGAEERSRLPQEDSPHAEDVTKALLDFRGSNHMKRLALEVVARTLNPGQIHALEKEFDRADSTNNGEVTLTEFKAWLSRSSAVENMGEDEVEALFKSIDSDKTGLIHFNEFLAATLQLQELDEMGLRAAFDRLDHSHTGYITVEDVALTIGGGLSEEEVTKLVKSFDVYGDGKVSFEEFLKSMRKIGPEVMEDLPTPPKDVDNLSLTEMTASSESQNGDTSEVLVKRVTPGAALPPTPVTALAGRSHKLEEPSPGRGSDEAVGGMGCWCIVM